MSKADELYRATCLDILEHGVWDTGQRVRPHWDDGAPAHTVKKFGVVNRYDLRESFRHDPARTAFQSCIRELCGSGRKSPIISTTWAVTSGTAGPMRPAPLAKPTAISWASNTSTPRENLTGGPGPV